ncbi:MAG TPA: hypothetical protein DCE52_04285 [Rhodobacteraceae bacterium]|nr:hypothetical protein [Paracoccaceae bacterium]
MNIDQAKRSYIDECNKVGKLARPVSYMTFDKYSEQYTIGNRSDGDIADLQPNGNVIRMHWGVSGG